MITLIGKTGSGKTTTACLLENYGYERAVTDTTRAVRPGEEDGISYNFLKEEEFLKNVEKGLYAEHISYETYNGRTMYGSRKELYDNPDGVIVLDPRGLKSVIANNVPCIKVYLRATENTLVDRLIERGDFMEDIYKRLDNDEPEFIGLEKIVDVIIDVDKLSPQEVVDEVLGFLNEQEEIVYDEFDDTRKTRRDRRISRANNKKRLMKESQYRDETAEFFYEKDGRLAKKNKHHSRLEGFREKTANRLSRRKAREEIDEYLDDPIDSTPARYTPRHVRNAFQVK